MEYGIQMYSVRDITGENLKEALFKVAELGYKYVEFAGFFGCKAEDVRDWLDAIADGLSAIREASYMLTWGTFNEDEGEYENTIQPCGDIAGEHSSFHIYKGIEKAAAAVGRGLSVDEKRESGDYPREYYFEYRGVRFFQLEKDKIKVEGVV